MRNLYKNEQVYIYSFIYDGYTFCAHFNINLTYHDLKEKIKRFKSQSIDSAAKHKRELYLCSIGPRTPPYFKLKQYVHQLVKAHGAGRVINVMFAVPDNEIDYGVDILECMEERLKKYFDE